MKQNLDKSNCIQLLSNYSWVPSRRWEFNLSHMPNPPDTNRIK